MGLNHRGRGNYRRGSGSFHGKSRRGIGRTGSGDVFISESTGAFFPRGPSYIRPQVFGGSSGLNSIRPNSGKFRRRNDNSNFFGKKNNSEVQEIDVTKPWVTEEIKSENKKKEEFLEIWKQTKSNDDWDKYKSQKLHVQLMNEKAKADYFARNPNEVNLWNSISILKDYYCEACDKSFRTEDDLLFHKAEHETCYCDGCEFTAHPKIIAKHIKMQHESGLYKRIGNLYTKEDIDKWIEERKKRYPTRKVIEDKKILEIEKLKRGERIKEDNSKFNKSFQKKNRGHRKKSFEKQTLRTKKRQTKKKNKAATICNNLPEDQLENIRNGVPAFSGIGNDNKTELPEKSGPNISDDEWMTEGQISNVAKPLLNSSLKLVAELYNSDEENISQTQQNEVSMECISADEGSGPEEVKTFICKNSLTEEESNNKKVPLKRKFLQKTEINNDALRNRLNQYHSEKQSETLLEKLLKKEIRRERNIILQCIRYIVDHNFFKT